MSANELKEKGNAALQTGDYNAAINFYAEAIELDSQNHVLFSNRSAAYCKAGKYDSALRDAEMCIKLKPEWGKGYSRKGAALEFLSRLVPAKRCYEDGLKHEPGNDQLKEALANVQKRLEEGDGERGFPNPFSDPAAMDKLRAHPKTRAFVDDPSFSTVLSLLKQNPNMLQSLLSDQRVMTAFGVLMGIDFESMPSGGARADGGNPMDVEDDSESDSESKPKPKASSASNSSATSSSAKPGSKTTGGSREAEGEKEKGNEAYKKRDFETALKHYGRAIELEPDNITFRTNKAAVLFEQAKYTECIEECEKAIEIGRENRADFKLIAKALARIGNAYVKLNDLQNAQRFYERSVTEHRERDVVLKLQEVVKKIKDQEREAYIDPAKAEEEKQEGNKYFQEGKFPEALKHYTEAIKRNPDDAKLYSNRAACYVKLLELQLALRDCDDCIRLDPKFIKGYLRKGQVLMAMKEEAKAAVAYRKALELDPNNEEATDGLSRAQAGHSGDNPEEIKKRAMQDPEVQAILSDPAMQLILQQMQKDPRALRDHLQNEEIATKIQKLIDVGIIGIR